MMQDINRPGGKVGRMILKWSNSAPLEMLSANSNQLAASAIVIEDILRIKEFGNKNKCIVTLRILNDKLYIRLFAEKGTDPDLDKADILLHATIRALKEAQKRDYLHYAEEVAAEMILKKWNSDHPISSCEELIEQFDGAPAIQKFIHLLCDIADSKHQQDGQDNLYY